MEANEGKEVTSDIQCEQELLLKEIAKEFLRLLSYLHRKGIAHQNISLDTILLDLGKKKI